MMEECRGVCKQSTGGASVRPQTSSLVIRARAARAKVRVHVVIGQQRPRGGNPTPGVTSLLPPSAFIASPHDTRGQVDRQDKHPPFTSAANLSP